MRNQLETFQLDIPRVNNARILIKNGQGYYKIRAWRYSKNTVYQKEELTTKHLKSLMDFVDKNPSDVDGIFDLNEDPSALEMMFKIDEGYLLISYFRN